MANFQAKLIDKMANFQAKLIDKTELPDGRLQVTVEYSDGVDTSIETFIPSDKQGYIYHTQQRCLSLSTAKELKEEDNIGKAITEAVPVDTRTAAEKAKDDWLVKYYKWISIKNNLVDTGVVPANHPQVVAFLDDVKAGFKPAYINYL